MSWADSHRIETPEQIDLDLDIAGPGSRFYAEIMDFLLKSLLIFLLAVPTIILLSLWGFRFGEQSPVNYFLLAVVIAAAVIILWGYDIYFEGCCNGQTPGKKTVGIRVVRETGAPIDLQQAAIRNVVGFVDLLPFFYLLGGVVSLLNRRGQRIGDMAAGTLVVRVRKGGLSDDVEAGILQLARDDFNFLPEQLQRCTAQDLHVLYSFFSRLSQLGRNSRLALGLRLMDTFNRKMALLPSRPIAEEALTESYLASLYRDLKAHREHH